MVPAGLEASVLRALAEIGIEPPATLTLERPRVPEHGDWSTNVALVVAKAAGRRPRDVADALAARLSEAPPPHVIAVEVAGPGFVNFRLEPGWLHDVLRAVVREGEAGYARHDVGGGTRVNIEFVSANPTGPLHAGHGRWAAYGDSLARVLERCGYVPFREFYVNDRGVQMGHFGASLAARKRGDDVGPDGYRGAYIDDWAAELPDGADPVAWGRDRAIRDQQETLAAMGVVFDRWSSEKALVDSGAMEATLAELRERGGTYVADGALWLRTSEHGDDKDRVLVKSDGQPTYFLPDIAYHRDKFNRGDSLINILGADHHGYVARMKAAVEILGHDRDDLAMLVGQNVVLVRDGAEVKLSKRRGDIILLREDVIDEVGADATRFAYLLTSFDTKLVFDIDVLVQQSMDNPVFYVQMAHARLAGIARTARDKGVEREPLSAVDLSVLVHGRELDLLGVINTLPWVVREAADKQAPNKVITWLRECAAAVHGFHHDCWVIGDDVPMALSQARLWLAEAAAIALRIGLGLVGVSAPERM
jgi:arginyl-tRNA synthetase